MSQVILFDGYNHPIRLEQGSADSQVIAHNMKPGDEIAYRHRDIKGDGHESRLELTPDGGWKISSPCKEIEPK